MIPGAPPVSARPLARSPSPVSLTNREDPSTRRKIGSVPRVSNRSCRRRDPPSSQSRRSLARANTCRDVTSGSGARGNDAGVSGVLHPRKFISRVSPQRIWRSWFFRLLRGSRPPSSNARSFAPRRRRGPPKSVCLGAPRSAGAVRCARDARLAYRIDADVSLDASRETGDRSRGRCEQVRGRDRLRSTPTVRAKKAPAEKDVVPSRASHRARADRCVRLDLVRRVARL